ncbi:hypothetical protein [Desulfatitalea alkaliphila]|uniref:Uncharacterized protein n=1 Tax=Desulfatitalea alkaliphila TaxID=2929485 RepID=A0AA41UPD1_9BACT|nr:hypothetical protein [Desulfatitalea alkaliphila]MCJ8500368.1 hypothetical protein [Desulfatitalea alkaliphila]
MNDKPVALIFAPSQEAAAQAIARTIAEGALVRPAAFHICRQVDEVRQAIQQLPRHRCLVILLAGCHRELDQMVAMASWFEDFALILMQPDCDKATFAKAHRLRPRYLMGPSIDLRELQAVVANLMTHLQNAHRMHSQETPSLLYRLHGLPRRFLRIAPKAAKTGAATKPPCQPTQSLVK